LLECRQNASSTRGSRKAGRGNVWDLLEHGYEVLNADLASPAERVCASLEADLCRLGEVFERARVCTASTPSSIWRPLRPLAS